VVSLINSVLYQETTATDVWRFLDHGTEVLSNCEQNIALNKELLLPESSEPSEPDRRVLPRRLNWLMQDPMDSIAEQPDQFDWSREEREEWRTKGLFIFAADGTGNGESKSAFSYFRSTLYFVLTAIVVFFCKWSTTTL
jgi:hypothetical protein